MSIYEYRPLLIYSVAVAAAFGAVMGSFLNCAAYRIARGESFLKGRSRCPACGHTLGARELVPVFSWILQGGRCRACGDRISVRYPLTELGFALLTAACLLRFDLTVLCLRNYIFLCCLFCLSLVDLEILLIPDEFHILAAAAWALSIPFVSMEMSEVIVHVITAVLTGAFMLLVSGILDRVLGRESLGGGDVKLLSVTGLYLGPVGTLFTLIISCALGLAVHGFREKSGGEGKEFPFGPSISAAAALMLLFGEPLIRWYTGLLGL